MQKTQIIGYIGKDAEVKDFNTNQVINFSVACTETWTKNGEKQSKTTWYEVARWGNNVKLAQYLKKGTQVYVEGTVEADAFIGNDGDAKGVLRLTAFKIELLSGGKSQSNNQTSDPKPKYDNFTAPEENEEDDLPF